jgi:hypothetical protein
MNRFFEAVRDSYHDDFVRPIRYTWNACTPAGRLVLLPFCLLGVSVNLSVVTVAYALRYIFVK